MATNIKCPEGHTKVWLKGSVPTRSGLKKRHICYICGRSFYATPEKPKPAPKTSKSKTKKAKL